MKWLRKAGGFLWSGAGAGLATAAAGAVAGNGAAVTMGLQMAAGGAVKKASKAAGREIHRVLSPAASMATLAIANQVGLDVPLELAAVPVAEGGAAGAVLEFVANGLLPGGLQGATNSSRKAVRDFRAHRAW